VQIVLLVLLAVLVLAPAPVRCDIFRIVGPVSFTGTRTFGLLRLWCWYLEWAGSGRLHQYVH
jgi:hypothetical protein